MSSSRESSSVRSDKSHNSRSHRSAHQLKSHVMAGFEDDEMSADEEEHIDSVPCFDFPSSPTKFSAFAPLEPAVEAELSPTIPEISNEGPAPTIPLIAPLAQAKLNTNGLEDELPVDEAHGPNLIDLDDDTESTLSSSIYPPSSTSLSASTQDAFISTPASLSPDLPATLVETEAPFKPDACRNNLLIDLKPVPIHGPISAWSIPPGQRQAWRSQARQTNDTPPISRPASTNGSDAPASIDPESREETEHPNEHYIADHASNNWMDFHPVNDPVLPCLPTPKIQPRGPPTLADIAKGGGYRGSEARGSRRNKKRTTIQKNEHPCTVAVLEPQFDDWQSFGGEVSQAGRGGVVATQNADDWGPPTFYANQPTGGTARFGGW